jgi:hypothetical protein
LFVSLKNPVNAKLVSEITINSKEHFFKWMSYFAPLGSFEKLVSFRLTFQFLAA